MVLTLVLSILLSCAGYSPNQTGPLLSMRDRAIARDTRTGMGDTAYSVLRRPTLPHHVGRCVASTARQEPHSEATDGDWPPDVETNTHRYALRTRHSPLFSQLSLAKEV